MKRIVRVIIGIVSAICSGFLLLMMLAAIGGGNYPGVSGLLDEVEAGNYFGVAILFSIFVLPIIAGIYVGIKEKHQIINVIGYPLAVGFLALIPTYLLAFIWAFVAELINEIQKLSYDNTILSTAIIVAAYIGFTTPMIVATIVIIDR